MISRKTQAHRLVGSGFDAVFGWAAIPSEGVFHGATIDLRATRVGRQDMDEAAISGMSGYVLPILDPDTLDVSPDTTWDSQVPKDEAIDFDSQDFDTATPDVTGDVSIVDPNAEIILDADSGPTKLFRREYVTTFADSPAGFLTGTPETFLATRSIRHRVSKKVRVKRPSVVLFAWTSGSAVVDSVFSGLDSLWAPGDAKDWMSYKYMANALELAQHFLTGASESGTDSPFDHLAQLVGRTVEQAFEDTADAFEGGAWNVWATCRYKIEVPGWYNMKSLSGG